jgi:AcrR family transcriptional regulator
MSTVAKTQISPPKIIPLRLAQRQMTRERIFTAAKQVFFEKGFGPANFEDIATLAGTRRSTLYTYFRDKDALFAAIGEEYTAGVDEIVAQIPRPVPTREEIGAWVNLLAAFVQREHTPSEFLIFSGQLIEMPPVVEKFGKHFMASLASKLPAFAKAQEPENGRARAWAMTVLRELGWAVCYRARHGDTDAARHKLAVAAELMTDFTHRDW